MAIDLMGPRFYTQQMKGGTRLKKDIVSDIETIMGIKLSSLMNVTKPTLEVLHDTLLIQKR